MRPGGRSLRAPHGEAASIGSWRHKDCPRPFGIFVVQHHVDTGASGQRSRVCNLVDVKEDLLRQTGHEKKPKTAIAHRSSDKPRNAAGLGCEGMAIWERLRDDRCLLAALRDDRSEVD